MTQISSATQRPRGGRRAASSHTRGRTSKKCEAGESLPSWGRWAPTARALEAQSLGHTVGTRRPLRPMALSARSLNSQTANLVAEAGHGTKFRS